MTTSSRHPTPPRRPPAAAVAAFATLLLAGCATVDPNAGFTTVEKAARERLDKNLRWVRSDADQALVDGRVAELLAQPLTVDAAVQVALLNNRGLQADFHELGIAEADRVQASRLANPGFSFGRLTRGSEVELERGFHLNLARLLMLPRLQQIQDRRFAQAQGAVTLRVLKLAADTHKAWIDAVAAEQGSRYQRLVMDAAGAGAELARRMAQVGNFNALQQAREQGFYADAALNLARAETARRSARERLIRRLGLWGEQTGFALPERLPDLPAAPRDQPDIERLAMAQRLDVASAKLAAEATAQSLGGVRNNRFVDVLELGAIDKRSIEAPTQRGWELRLELPLFDWGDARLARADSQYQQALQRTAAVAVNARSEVREAYGAYRDAWDIARHHRDEIVPLRQRIADENLLRYNGMLIGVFELLADARSQIAGVNAAITALRDFWRAQAELEMALIGPPETGMAGAAAALPAAADTASGGH